MTSDIPKNWRLVPLSDLVKCQGGSAFSPSLQGKKNGEIPFYKVSDVNLSGNGWSMHKANNYIDNSELMHISGTTKPAGSVIFPKVGAAIHTNKKRFLIKPALVDNNVMAVWTTNEKLCLPDFLYLYFLRLPLSELSNPGPLPSINNSKVYEQSILLPPIKEQKIIVDIIQMLRAYIEVEEKILTTMAELKNSAMQQLFTRGLQSKKQKETEIGLVPENWDVVPIEKHLLLAQYGLSLKGEEKGKYPILRMNCQVDGNVLFRNLQYVDLDAKTFSNFRVNDGDLLFNRTNSFELVGRTAIFRSSNEAVFASYLIRLSFDKTYFYPEFVNYYLNQPLVQKDLKRLASRGVSQSNISASKLKTYFIPKPPREEQEAISSLLQELDKKIALHRRKKSNIQAMFQLFLNDLMNGAIHVNDLDVSKLN